MTPDQRDRLIGEVTGLAPWPDNVWSDPDTLWWWVWRFIKDDSRHSTKRKVTCWCCDNGIQHIVRPEWGTYSVKCSTCGGSGKVMVPAWTLVEFLNRFGPADTPLDDTLMALPIDLLGPEMVEEFGEFIRTKVVKNGE